jgi:hypothetical protein
MTTHPETNGAIPYLDLVAQMRPLASRAMPSMPRPSPK